MRQWTRNENSLRRVPVVEIESTVDVTDDPHGGVATLSPDDSVMRHPHRLEQDVRNRLMEEPDLHFTSLVVRRMQDGLCLEGVLETDDEVDEVAVLVRHLCGVSNVVNNLVIHRRRELPRKG